jgi:hypothetical protein
MLVFPEGFTPLFLPAEMLPASLLIPVLLPPAFLPAVPARPVVEPFMDEPVVLPLAAGPPAADPPPCANTNGPATASATARIIDADFMLLLYFASPKGIKFGERGRSSSAVEKCVGARLSLRAFPTCRRERKIV